MKLDVIHEFQILLDELNTLCHRTVSFHVISQLPMQLAVTPQKTKGVHDRPSHFAVHFLLRKLYRDMSDITQFQLRTLSDRMSWSNWRMSLRPPSE